MPLLRTCLLLALLASGLTGQGEQDDLTDLPVHTRPGADQGATRLDMLLFVNDVMRIIDVDQTFTADLWLEVQWTDPRLAEPGAPARIFALDHVWHPALQLINLDFMRRQLPDHILVDPSGRCTYSQRFIGTLSVAFDLHEFPFDEQVLPIQIVTLMNSPEDIEIVVNERIGGRRDDFSVLDWEVGELAWEVRPVQLRTGGRAMAGVEATMPAQRYSNYYTLKVIAPLLFILAMSWAVFWVDPDLTGPQISLGATSVLTLIAYRFLLGNLVPHISYMTRLDIFIFGATVLVFVAFIEAVVTTTLARHGRSALALRLDRTSRIGAPLAVAALLWYSFG